MDGQTSEQGSQASASLKVTLEPHPEPRTRIFSQTGEEEFEQYVYLTRVAFWHSARSAFTH